MADFPSLSAFKRETTGAANGQAPASLGRFELKRMLGQGAQSQVWLGFDPRLEREVAIKLMKPMRGQDAAVVAQWLQEARSVSRLNHPNIVPVFEADVQDNQPYLVFEYVAGQTLTEMLAKHGVLPPVQAVKVLQDVLGALVAAHAAGVVHRDLKPSNVLIDATGRARVMDFGIAVRIKNAAGDQATSVNAGTPAYMSPEAARGESVTPLMDVYSAGLLLAEALSGKPMITEADPYRVIYKVAHEQLLLPANLLANLDDKLRATLLRSLAHEPDLRFPSAQLFLDELDQWSRTGEGWRNVDAGAQSSTLEFLLRRMRHKSDFPALSESIIHIQNMATSDKESVSSVTNEILKNVALTNKLLRLVNSAHYARGNKIGTVSRAVTLVGFNGIRNMALSLMLLENMQDRKNAHFLKEEFLRALMSGSIASELGTPSGHAEEAFIGGMFHNLGRMLSQFYFSEEAATVRGLMSSRSNPISEEVASTRVLGISYKDLGVGVAKVWGLPASIQKCIAGHSGEPPTQMPIDMEEQTRWIALTANEMADAMLEVDPLETQRLLEQSARRYGKVLGMSAASLQSSSVSARIKFIDLADAMNFHVPADSRVAHLLKNPQDPITNRTKLARDALQSIELHATQAVSTNTQTPERRRTEQMSQILAAGIQDITNAMVEDFKFSDVLHMILEAMYRALEFHRIILCMRDPKTDVLTGRFGLGQGIEAVVKSFFVPLHTTGKPDLFGAICGKGADTLIRDASDPRIVASLPAWYHKSFNAPTFLILPLLLKGKPFGLIYADKKNKGGLSVDEKELALLRTLRNQAIMAFKQSF